MPSVPTGPIALSPSGEGHILHDWLALVYGVDDDRAWPQLADRVFREHLALATRIAVVACAIGDEDVLLASIGADPAWVNRPMAWTCPTCGVQQGRPPLVAVTHSSLIHIAEYREPLRRCARLLLDAGADPNQSWTGTGPPLSALYGAAGKNHDAVLTEILLAAGANPNDGESLYHSMESRDVTCARLLLEAGAKVAGSNALHHNLDTDNLEGLRLLLAHGADPNDASLGLPIIWAIRRRRSGAHVAALLAAGADPHANSHGVSAYRFASLLGLPDVAAALADAGAAEPLSSTDEFIAACARADESAARGLLERQPGIIGTLSPIHLSLLPSLAAEAGNDGVRLMVTLGWPIAAIGGDLQASALNYAVFRGDAALTRFLLEHGARWIERHCHNDNVKGTLAWASRNHDPAAGDWVGCARALVEHGMPAGLEGRTYSAEVTEFLAPAGR
ncbi:MAG: ankyrin repeat domain-containing protein [Vicinamibacterales bacterium]